MSQNKFSKNPLLTKIPAPDNDIELIKVLGKGNFGYVYKGRIKTTDTIAAIKVVALKEEELKEILLEVEMLKKCSHKNVVRFYGLYIKHFRKNSDLWVCLFLTMLCKYTLSPLCHITPLRHTNHQDLHGTLRRRWSRYYLRRYFTF